MDNLTSKLGACEHAKVYVLAFHGQPEPYGLECPFCVRDRLRGQLEAAEQHVKILQEQRAALEPPAASAVATAIARVENELSLFQNEPEGYSEFATDLHTLIAAARAAQPPSAAQSPSIAPSNGLPPATDS